MSTKKETPKAKEIVIDGPNLGMAHSGNSWPASSRGIEIGIRYYQNLGWDVRAFVPRHYLRQGGNRGVDDHKLLEKLLKEGSLFATPSQDHDDHYWIAYALQTGALVVTNDRMKNHAEEHSEGKEDFYKWRDEKVMSYMFVEDTFIPNPDFDLPPAPKKGESKAKQVKGTSSKPPTSAKSNTGKKNKDSPVVDSSVGFAILDQGLSAETLSVRNTLRHVITQHLDKGACDLTKLGQHVVNDANKTMRSEYKSRKDLMKAASIPSSKAFYQQLSLLMGDLVEFTKSGKRITKVKWVNTPSSPLSTTSQPISQNRSTPKTKPKTSEKNPSNKPRKKGAKGEAKGSVKRMTLIRFKDHLGNKRKGKLSCQRNELPKAVDASLDMLCKLRFPADMAMIGNKYKDITGSKLTASFSKPDRLAWFLNLRKECPLRDLVADGHLIVRKSKQNMAKGMKKENLKASSSTTSDQREMDDVKPMNKVVRFLRSLFSSK